MRHHLLVFSDLDGTLLDHDSYAWQAAAPALARLAAAEIPLIFNSSKTAAEIRALRRELGNHHPYIVENGGAVCLPTAANGLGETIQVFGRRYDQIRALLENLRRQRAYPFVGFGDLGPAGIARATGLDRVAAERAADRQASEPLLWQGGAAQLERFRADLEEHGLQLVPGGRFLHVMGEADKGRAMAWLTERYRQADPERRWLTVALGDAENDRPMLERADLAVVIPGRDGRALNLKRSAETLCPEQPGPAGWQAALEEILDRFA